LQTSVHKNKDESFIIEARLFKHRMRHMKKVMVFGVFDGLHEGHRAFLRLAKELGDELVVALTDDGVVLKLKNHAPRQAFRERMDALKREFPGISVVKGDKEIGKWKVLRAVRPDIIALGHDQTAILKALRSGPAEIVGVCILVQLPPHHPEIYKSSLAKHREAERL